jgi:nucleotide-binding universal stress UspA family protein
MYKKILVPLDGSKLAECALPHAEELAKGCNTEEVILVSVTELIEGYKVIGNPTRTLVEQLSPGAGKRRIHEVVGKLERQARRYLGRIAKTLEAKGIRVRMEVPLGKPAEEIVGFAEREGADIIVMSSHGRSGPSRWVHGSVADKVLRSSCVPVVMVRAPGCFIDFKND